MTIDQKAIVAQLEARYLIEKSWFATLGANYKSWVVIFNKFDQHC